MLRVSVETTFFLSGAVVLFILVSAAIYEHRIKDQMTTFPWYERHIATLVSASALLGMLTSFIAGWWFA